MVIRISNVPEGLKPGECEVRFVRLNGDVAMYEYVPPLIVEEVIT